MLQQLSFTSNSDAAMTQVHLLTSANNMIARGRTRSSSEVRAGPNVSICSWYGVNHELAVLKEHVHACGGRTWSAQPDAIIPVVKATCCLAAGRQQLRSN